MKESISYAFLLNIIILFVVVCFAIVMGIFSYNRAFRANTIISQTIEKYEGYNCASKEEIALKLDNISYNTPFRVSCNNKETPCEVDPNSTYAVISYNLDINGNKYAGNNLMSSTVDTQSSQQTRTYQYGIYTYMYFDIPVISKLAKIPFFSKTDIMYEFRNLKYDDVNKTIYDERNIPEQYTDIIEYNGKFSDAILYDYANQNAGIASIFLNVDSNGYRARERAKIDTNDDGQIGSIDGSLTSNSFEKLYLKYGVCNGEKKVYENY